MSKQQNFDQQRRNAMTTPVAEINSNVNEKGEKVVDDLNSVVDLSKIKNMEAVSENDSAAAKMIEKKIISSPHKAAKRKFCFMDPVSVQLPSHGRFYQDSEDEDLRNGIIKLYPMSVAEEEILTNQAYTKSGTAIRMLFDSCMASDYDAGKLLSFDSTFLLYYLRKISYGSDYTFSIKCSECKKEYKYTLDISDVEFEELPEDAQDVYDITLPRSKYAVSMTLPRIIQDENEIKIKNRIKDVSDQIADMISHTVSVRSPDGEEISPSMWGDFFKELPSIDRAEITKTFAFTKNNPKVTVTCPYCGNDEEVSIPMDLDFFRMA